MRRSIMFLTRHRRNPTAPVLRLFWMNDAQASFFARAVAAVAERLACDPDRASGVVENVVVHYLQGMEPGTGSPPVLYLGRSLFPALTDAEVEQLPRNGAPVGRITGIVFLIADVVDGAKQQNRSVVVRLNRSQADAYNSALFNVAHELKVTRDEAWLHVNTIVGRLLGGATPTEEANKTVRDLYAVFPAIDIAAAEPATEDDIRQFSCTTAPVLVL